MKNHANLRMKQFAFNAIELNTQNPSVVISSIASPLKNSALNVIRENNLMRPLVNKGMRHSIDGHAFNYVETRNQKLKLMMLLTKDSIQASQLKNSINVKGCKLNTATKKI